MQENLDAKTSNVGDLCDKTHDQDHEAQTCGLLKSIGTLSIPPRNEPQENILMSRSQTDSDTYSDVEPTHENLHSHDTTTTGLKKFLHSHEQVKPVGQLASVMQKLVQNSAEYAQHILGEFSLDAKESNYEE
jgi:hypothetical protein